MRLKVALGTSILAASFALAGVFALERAALAVGLNDTGPGSGQRGVEPLAGG
jgi:hypothetical protein